MSSTEAEKRASKKYASLHMDVISLKAKKEIISYIKNYTKTTDLSNNKYCLNAILYCIENDINLVEYNSIDFKD